MSPESHGSIITRSTVQPRAEDRVALWRQKRFIVSVRDDVRAAIHRALERHHHYLSLPNSFFRLPELDDLLDFLAVPHEHRQVDRRSGLRFLLSLVGWIGLLVLVFAVVILAAVAVAP